MAKTTTHRIGWIVILALIGVLAGTAGRGVADEETTPVRDGVFIHLSQAVNEHRALMGLKMATVMAGDRDVLVYLDLQAVRLVGKGERGLVIRHEHFPSSAELLATLKEKGVAVYACPTCMKVAGLKPADLLDGVQVANKAAFFDFTKGRILSLDY